jgi:hypothetical protein
VRAAVLQSLLLLLLLLLLRPHRGTQKVGRQAREMHLSRPATVLMSPVAVSTRLTLPPARSTMYRSVPSCARA